MRITVAENSISVVSVTPSVMFDGDDCGLPEINFNMFYFYFQNI